MSSLISSRARKFMIAGIVISTGCATSAFALYDRATTSPHVYGLREEDKNKKVVIVGGGAAGIGVASMLRNEGMRHVTIVEPSKLFYYQPLWTLVGAGIKNNEDSVLEIDQVLPKGTTLVNRCTSKFEPEKNRIVLNDGSVLQYDYLVVAAGIQIDWHKIQGLEDALRDDNSGVVSIYDYHHSKKAWNTFNKVEKGRILFTMPNSLIKCAGAPQKIMWLIEEMLRERNVRDQSSVEFWVPGAAMFGIKKYSDMLEKIREERGVQAHFKQELVSVDGKNKKAVFKSLVDHTLSEQSYDTIHVTPPMSAPDFIKTSPLAAPSGWMEVNKHTLQSTKFENVFGIGDCTDTPNSKTAAAVTAQAPVLVHNLLQHSLNRKLDGHYNGYASCPLIIGKNKVILAEFGYGGQIMETFSRETGKFPYSLLGQEGLLQQRFFYWMKETMFPLAYWKLWVKGHWYGTSCIFKPCVVPERTEHSS